MPPRNSSESFEGNTFTAFVEEENKLVEEAEHGNAALVAQYFTRHLDKSAT
jgi:hypothetical protein